MSNASKPLFSFSEEDHLTRIHLRLALEDLGFAVEESADELRLVGQVAERDGRGGAAGPARPSDRHARAGASAARLNKDRGAAADPRR